MRIDHISIDNYRRFAHFECDFDPQFTLLIGPNGSGKSSLLKAIFDGLGLLFGGGIDDQDVRRIDTVDPGDSRWRTAVYPSVIRTHIAVASESLRLWQQRGPTEALPWPTGEFNDPRVHADFSRVRQLLSAWMEPSQPDPVPVVARFGAAGSFIGAGRPDQVRQPFENKREAWDGAKIDHVDIQRLAQWFQYNELRTLQEGKTPISYRVAREAVLSAIHALDIRYVVRDNQLMVLHDGEGWRPFDRLSDGQKRIAAIFCELALRCAALNSHLAERCVIDTPGVVLIDELDLHLHPLWQRRVIGDLCRVFPRLQFIVASHSPFLLQAAFEVGKVLDMQTGQFAQAGDLSIEDIAEEVMGVDQPQRSQRFLALKAAAKHYMDVLATPTSAATEREAQKLKLDVAMAAFANEPASAAWLAQQREAAGL